MFALLIAIVLGLPLGPPFGEAELTAVSSTQSTLTLEARVEVLTGTQIVLVQPYDSAGQPMDPRPMSDLGDGRWAAVLEVPRRSDISIGFEILDGGLTVRSEVHSLVELGVDAAVFRDPAPDPIDEEEQTSRDPALAWLALAAGAAAVALVLLAGRRVRPRKDRGSNDGAEVDTEAPDDDDFDTTATDG